MPNKFCVELEVEHEVSDLRLHETASKHWTFAFCLTPDIKDFHISLITSYIIKLTNTNITFDIKRWLVTMGAHIASTDDMLQLPWLFFNLSSKEKAGTSHALQRQ